MPEKRLTQTRSITDEDSIVPLSLNSTKNNKVTWLPPKYYTQIAFKKSKSEKD